jgi:hypothetical protein
MRISIIGVASLLAVSMSAGAPQARQEAASLTVYKSPTCGCCSLWVQHMRSHGFEVKTVDVDDVGRIKAAYGVPSELGSCHTALVGGYVVEGHVPGDAVQRLLRERPNVAGLAVPGMPIGSPGMEVGDRRDPYSIFTFDRAGERTLFERR